MTQEEFHLRYTFSAQDIISNCGGLGSIYRAYDNVLHREVTIKEVRTGGEEKCIAFGGAMFWQDFECKANLQDEFELLKHIPQHPNIAYYKDLYSFKGYDYAVLPYKIESDLNNLIRRGLTMEQKESIATQMLDGLSFLHENKIVHGSFDPWSILIVESRNGFIPIMTNIGLKKTIVNVSVEAYAPNDEFRNRAFGDGSFGEDIEMYGIVLYELFTGRPLYEDYKAPYEDYRKYIDFYDDSAPCAAAEMYWDIVIRLSKELPLPWRKVFEKCIIPDNTSWFDKPDNVTTKDLYVIINDFNVPELLLVDDDNQPSNMQSIVINGYTLRYQLGEGGMAEVWYAENKIGKKAAVKMLLPKFCDDEDIVARFENEAKVMVKLEHPNIRQVYDYTLVDNRPCIIMEYLEGEDLKSMMKQGRQFTHEELVKWWNQMVAALNYTHQLGVVHRDIKPSNIFIDKYGNVRLLDFGIAKNFENEARTRTGSTMGTLLYMSPEQVKDPKRVSYKSDIYSLAVTFVHLVSNKAPYDSTSSSNFDIQMDIVHKPLDVSGLSPVWRKFLEQYLVKGPKNRPELRDYNGNVDFYREDGILIWDDNPEDERIKKGISDGVVPGHGQSKVEKRGEDLVVTVNGVSFVMKSVEGNLSLNDYYIGETPVTQALWEAVMGNNPSLFKGNDLPVDFGLPNFEDDREFIPELNKMVGQCFRLPSEAEWEYAARGGRRSKGYKYAGSNDLSTVAWYRENSNDVTHPVKQKRPNELGLFDLCGNVQEPCKDGVDKGGCYAFDKKDCRIVSRDDRSITSMGCWKGIRLAMSIE